MRAIASAEFAIRECTKGPRRAKLHRVDGGQLHGHTRSSNDSLCARFLRAIKPPIVLFPPCRRRAMTQFSILNSSRDVESSRTIKARFKSRQSRNFCARMIPARCSFRFVSEIPLSPDGEFSVVGISGRDLIQRAIGPRSSYGISISGATKALLFSLSGCISRKFLCNAHVARELESIFFLSLA